MVAMTSDDLSDYPHVQSAFSVELVFEILQQTVKPPVVDRPKDEYKENPPSRVHSVLLSSATFLVTRGLRCSR